MTGKPQIPREAAKRLDPQGHDNGQCRHFSQLAFLLQTAVQQPGGQRGECQNNAQKGQPPQFIDEGSQKGVAVASRQGLIEGQRRAPRAFAEPLRCAKGLSDGAGLIPGAGGVQFRVKCTGKPPGDKIRAICIEEDSGTQSRSAEDNGTHGFPPADSKPVVPGRDDQQDKACQQKQK